LTEGSWHPPSWIYQEKRPANDDVYFENMTRVIFLAGLSWKMIDKKWPNFKKAFKNFSIAEVAKFDEKEIKQLMNDAGIVRNQAKIVAAINNAKQLLNIRKEHGSFQSYLDKLDKSNNYALVIKELGKKFSRLGPSSARIFFYSVGENVRRQEEVNQ
jgi:3-methyladenine DNA glycosylase Tag